MPIDILEPPAAGPSSDPEGAENLPPSPPDWTTDPDDEGRATWGQDYDDDGSVVDRFADEGGEPKQEPKGTPEPARAAADQDRTALEDRIRQLEHQLAEDRGRQSYADQMRSQEELQRRQAEYAALQQPPEFDVEEAMSDPDRFRQALSDYGEWTRRRTLAEVQPYLEAVQQMHQAQGPMANLAMNAAWQEAERQLQSEGINNAADYRQDVNTLISNSADGWRHALDPASLAEGVRFVRRHRGEPEPVRQPTKTTPDLPGGSSSPRSGKPQKTRVLSHVERAMGIKFTDADLREHAERQQGRV